MFYFRSRSFYILQHIRLYEVDISNLFANLKPNAMKFEFAARKYVCVNEGSSSPSCDIPSQVTHRMSSNDSDFLPALCRCVASCKQKKIFEMPRQEQLNSKDLCHFYKIHNIWNKENHLKAIHFPRIRPNG